MGVPGLVMNYYKKYNKTNELTIEPSQLSKMNVGDLFFDSNSLIHPCAHQILSANHDKYLLIDNINVRLELIEKDIIINCINYTKFIISQISPENVYLIIDGVAPRSKMNQQRERRYKSEFLRQNIPLWDSNNITPGTRFMDKLIQELENFCNINKYILSDSNDPGEGEHKIMKIINKSDKKTMIYGLDCITEDTPLLLLNEHNEIEIKTVERLNDVWKIKENGKEYGKCNYKIWSESGWTKIENIMRRKVNKDIYRVLTNTGCIDVTEDHKLLKNDKNTITPKKCSINDSLLHSFPYFEENKLNISEINNLSIIELRNLASKLKIKQYQKFKKNDLIEKIDTIYLDEIIINLNKKCDICTDEAYIMGLWWADGSSGIYKYKNNKNKVKNGYMTNYQWYISNCDIELLKNAKTMILKIYNVNSTIFEDKSHILKPNRQKIYKLKINGGKSIQNIIDKYINMFYYKNKHLKYKNGNKYIPTQILNSNREIRESFLLGYYNGDGTGHSLNVVRKSMDVESKISCQSIYYLCKSLGYEVSINIRDDKPSVYKLLITKGYQTKDKNKIKKIINLGKTDKYVYDLQTSNHHFQAGIGQMIVHNCDLVFLSILHKYSDQIILIRDNTFNDTLTDVKKVIDFIDISCLKGYIYNDFNDIIKLTKYGNSNILKDKLIDDYIFICFLLGNDFLERLPSLYIKKNGIDTLMKAYSNAYKGEYLIKNNVINTNFLKDIFYQLRNHETYFFKNYNSETFMESSLIENKFSNVNFYMDTKEDTLLDLKVVNYKQKYNLYYGLNNLNDTCLNYIEGLLWTFLYYKGHLHNNWSWYYNHHNSPFCSDLFEFIKNNEHAIKVEKINFIKDVAFMPIKQLCLVLPKKSLISILKELNYNKDDSLIKFINNSNYYPEQLFIDIINKRYLWQSKIFFNNINDNIIDLIL